MTPIQIVNYAAARFADGFKGAVPFEVPAKKSMKSFAQSIRELAKKRKYKWRVVYYQKGRTWLIKQKGL